MAFRIETFCLPDFWASYFVNGDASGLEDAEQSAADAWWRDTFPADSAVSCADCSEESEFVRFHDADRYVLPCGCLTYTFLVFDADPASGEG